MDFIYGFIGGFFGALIVTLVRYLKRYGRGSQRDVEGLWAVDDPRRIFVEGAKWWEFESTGGTMWPSDRDKAEAEAERRFSQEPNGTQV